MKISKISKLKMRTYVKSASLSNSPRPFEDRVGELMGCIIDIDNPQKIRHMSEKEDL